jgi:parallel beta-helix repeat protein
MKNKITSLILLVTLILTVSGFQSSFFALATDDVIIINPGESIQTAINNAFEGQTIYMKKGTYTINSSLIVNKTVTILGESINETVIDGHEEITLIFGILAGSAEIRNLTVSGSGTHGFGIHIKDVANVKIQSCRVKNCGQGIRLTNSTNCEISKNVIINNEDYGIYFTISSSQNTIFWNNIKNNSQGISIDLGCSSNTFHQNNFIQNMVQTSGLGVSANLWNATYPAGGNYWSNYVSADTKKGPYQNETGSDGIGDNPHEEPTFAKDYYPIMGHIHWFHSYKTESMDYYTLVSNNISNTCPSNFHFDSNEAFINFTLTANLETGLCRIAIPKQLLWVENGWIITIDDETTAYIVMSDTSCTYISFSYNYSDTKTIKIQGTDCIPEFSLRTILLFAVTIMVALVVVKTAKTSTVSHCRSKFQKV